MREHRSLRVLWLVLTLLLGLGLIAATYEWTATGYDIGRGTTPRLIQIVGLCIALVGPAALAFWRDSVGWTVIAFLYLVVLGPGVWSALGSM